MLPGTTVRMNPDLKDELIFEGIDNQNVSLSCSQVSQVCKIGDKDNRKFLDGIYVSERGQMQWNTFNTNDKAIALISQIY